MAWEGCLPKIGSGSDNGGVINGDAAEPLNGEMVKGLKYIVLGVNVAFFALMAAVLPLQFEENDDIMMAMIANGAYSGTPDCHLVYINVIYGAVLAFLYGLTKAVEWYTLTFAALHVLSMSVLVYFVLTMENRSSWERWLWIIVLYVLWVRIIVALQFTTTAGLVCLAGCMLLLRESKKARWSGVALVVIAALIRFMAAGLVGLLMAPIIVYTYRLEWRKYIAVVVMLMAVVGCRMVNRYVYESDPEWKYYREYNQLRAQLNDNPNAYQLQPEQLPEGVEWTDYRLLLSFIPDPEQIDLPTIRQISAVVDNMPIQTQAQNLHRLEKYAVEIAILTVLLVLMILTTGNRSKYIFLILYSFFMAALMIHVSLDGFLKNRVFLCMLLPLLMTDFMLLPKTTGLKRRWGLVIALLCLSGWYCYQIRQVQLYAGYQRAHWTLLQQPLLDRVPKEASIVTIGSTMRVDAMNPWHIWPYQIRKYTLGWTTWLPLNKPMGHSYRALLRDEMYIFTDRNYERENSRIKIVQSQIEDHYGVPTEVKWKYRNGRYAIVQLKIIN